MTGALVAGLLAGYGVALPVGAIGTYLVGVAARDGMRVGIAAALGVATTDGLYALTATLGGAGARRALTPVAVPLRYLAAFAVLALAARTLRTALRTRVRDADTPAGTAAVSGGAAIRPGRTYLRLLGLTALNPSTVGYFVALVMGRHAVGTWTATVLFVAGAVIASASWQLVLVGGGAALGRVVTGARGRLGIALASAAIMVALAVMLVL